MKAAGVECGSCYKSVKSTAETEACIIVHTTVDKFMESVMAEVGQVAQNKEINPVKSSGECR